MAPVAIRFGTGAGRIVTSCFTGWTFASTSASGFDAARSVVAARKATIAAKHTITAIHTRRDAISLLSVAAWINWLSLPSIRLVG